jgi:hypothetical protein
MELIMIISSKSFGILASERVEKVIDDQEFRYLVFKDANGIEWHDLVEEHGPFDQYIAVSAEGVIISMEPNPDATQIGGFEIIGLKTGDGFAWTNGPGGSVYGTYWNGTEIIAPKPDPFVKILPAVTLWERLTENEADQVNEAMATQSVRTQRIFTTANTFRSDHELWPLLEQMATELFGETRAAELLVP